MSDFKSIKYFTWQATPKSAGGALNYVDKLRECVYEDVEKLELERDYQSILELYETITKRLIELEAETSGGIKGVISASIDYYQNKIKNELRNDLIIAEFETEYYINPVKAEITHFKIEQYAPNRKKVSYFLYGLDERKSSILIGEWNRPEYYIVLALDKFLTEYNIGICKTFDKAVESLTNLFGVELVKLTTKL